VRRRKEGKWRRGEDVDDKKVVFKKNQYRAAGRCNDSGPWWCSQGTCLSREFHPAEKKRVHSEVETTEKNKHYSHLAGLRALAGRVAVDYGDIQGKLEIYPGGALVHCNVRLLGWRFLWI
jgi:hypothetical protein